MVADSDTIKLNEIINDLKTWKQLFLEDFTLVSMVNIPKITEHFVRNVESICLTKPHNRRKARIRRMHKESSVMIGSRVAMEVRVSQFSRKRLRNSTKIVVEV